MWRYYEEIDKRPEVEAAGMTRTVFIAIWQYCLEKKKRGEWPTEADYTRLTHEYIKIKAGLLPGPDQTLGQSNI